MARHLRHEPLLVFLESTLPEPLLGRYTFLAIRPLLCLRAWGASCEVIEGNHRRWLYGNPWMLLERLYARFELGIAEQAPWPLGGFFGYWGYDLKHFLEPRLPRRAAADLGLPDLEVGLYDSLLVWDNQTDLCWLISTGLRMDGTRQRQRARVQADRWLERIEAALAWEGSEEDQPLEPPNPLPEASSTLEQEGFVRAVDRALEYIAAGDIYQVNLSQRLSWSAGVDPFWLHQQLRQCSPAPFAGVLRFEGFSLVSASPEEFLRMSGRRIRTRPIKGTRPRGADACRDQELSRELTASGKERSELVMITDLLRNDLGRVCEFGSVRVPELMRLESYAQVHHLVSTVEGRARPEVSHLGALAACFPGGSVTGAPKVRAMEIIEELEPVTRGPYTGTIGYLGLNGESRLAIAIRTAVCLPDRTCLHVGAGIVAESSPEAEYAETLAKAEGFRLALESSGGSAARPKISGGV